VLKRYIGLMIVWLNLVTGVCADVIFRDSFESDTVGVAPQSEKWSIIRVGDSRVIVDDGIVTNHGVKMAKLVSVAPNDRAGLFTQTSGRYKSFKVEANVILDYDTSPHGTCIDLRNTNGAIVVSLRLVPVTGTGKYDAKILYKEIGRSPAVVKTIKSDLIVGQWKKWALAVSIDEEHTGRGTLSVFLNDRALVTDKPFYPFTDNTGWVDVAEFWTSKGQTRIDAVVIDASTKPKRPVAQKSSQTFYELQDLSTADFDMAIGKSGEIEISVAGKKFTLESRFSLPGGKWMELSQQNGSAYPLKTVIVSENIRQIEVTNSQYRLLRTLTRYPAHVAVHDKITNLTDGLIGIRLDNQITTEGDIEGSTICGCLAPPCEKSSPERPFVHLVSSGAGVGLIARDDVYRNQAICHGTEKMVGIRSDNFAMAPRTSYTLKWEIYPRNSVDYYDFINTVRRVWQTTSRTIPYACGFFDYRLTYKNTSLDKITDAQLKEWIEFCGVKAFSFVVTSGSADGLAERPNGGEVEAFGSDYLNRPTARDFIAKQVEMAHRIKRLCPDVRVGPYTHYSLNPDDDPLAEQYRDARVMLSDGQQWHWSNTLFGYHYPTRKNHFGQMIKTMYEKMIEDFGENVYIDEYGLPQLAQPVYMHDVPDWDEHSVVIDLETNQVIKKVTNLSLVTRPYRDSVANMGGGISFANCQPATELDTLRDTTYFLEYLSTHDYPRGHLVSPVVYIGGGLSRRQFMGFVYDSLQYGLIAGVDASPGAHTDYPSPLNFFFPITVQELRPGYIIGKERIITSRPGRYTFGDDSDLSLVIYNTDGLPGYPKPETEVIENKRYVTVEMAMGEVAIIIRSLIEKTL